MAPKIVLLAGEESGDGHGARLIAALRALRPDVEIHGMGGERMAAAGMQLIRNLDGMQIMGFWEVIKRLSFVKAVFQQVERAIHELQPDLVCGIDYPGFNLRMEKRCHAAGIRTAHYIAPQVWAWKKGRAKQMARYLDLLITIFDFEKPFFAPHGLRTEFVGHPLIEGYDRAALWERSNALADRLHTPGAKWSGPDSVVDEQRVVQPLVLMPGSRQQVLRNHVERFVAAAEETRRRLNKTGESMPIWVVRAPSTVSLPVWAPVQNRVTFVDGELSAAAFLGQAILSSSGTATLEAGLTGTPLTVAYVGGAISAALAHLIVDIPVISLVNIVLGGYLIEENLQGEASPGALAAQLKRLCEDMSLRQHVHQRLLTLPGKLGFDPAGGLTPSARAAQLLIELAAASRR